MRPLHVAQINVVQPPPGLAVADVFEQWPSLADVADAVCSAGTRVSVIQAARQFDRITRAGVDYHFMEVDETETMIHRGQRYAHVLDELKADVLHVHGLDAAADAFAISQWLPQLPILFQDHANRPPRWWRRPQWRRWYSIAAGASFTAPELAKPFLRARLLDPGLQLFAIPESSSRFTHGSRARARAETGVYGDPCVVWVGHLNAGKDPLTVLDGVALAAAKLPGLQLWCAFGSAPLLPAVRRRIDGDPMLAGRVHLLGKVAHARVELLMRAADLFVSGSHAESCGYSLLEAMACGVTPVVTDIPSFRRLIGDIGHLWPCGDAQKLADALIVAARQPSAPARVRAHFDNALSFNVVGRQWSDAYRKVLAAQRKGIR